MNFVILIFLTVIAIGGFLYVKKVNHIVLSDLIFFILPLNVISDILIPYTNIGPLHTGVIRQIILFILILIYFKYIKESILSLIIGFFLIYLLVLSTLSSDVLVSLNTYFKLFTALMFFLIFYSYNLKPRDFYKINLSIFISIILVILNFVMAQYLGFGSRHYLEDELYSGIGGGGSLSNILCYGLLTTPLFLKYFKKNKTKLLILLVATSGFVTMVLLARRGPLAGLVLGFIIFLVLKKNKSKFIIFLIFLSSLSIISYPIYEDLLDRLIERKTKVGLEETARNLEIQYVVSQFDSDPIAYKLFGSELFNSKYIFSDAKLAGRTLHTDYAAYLNGSGLVGLFTYLMILIIIIYKGIKYYIKIRDKNAARDHLSVLVSICIASFFISVTKQVTVLSTLVFLFAYLGTLLSVLRKTSELR